MVEGWLGTKEGEDSLSVSLLELGLSHIEGVGLEFRIHIAHTGCGV